MKFVPLFITPNYIPLENSTIRSNKMCLHHQLTESNLYHHIKNPVTAELGKVNLIHQSKMLLKEVVHVTNTQQMHHRKISALRYNFVKQG
jgi:hypothetical protein